MTLHLDVRELCRWLVENHAEQEVELFDVVWDAFWRARASERVEQLATRGRAAAWSTVAVLGAIGPGQGQGLDSLHLIAVISETVAQLLGKQQGEEVTLTAVHTVMAGRMAHLATPAHVQRVLTRHGSPMVAALFGVETDSEDAVAGELEVASVEWQGTSGPCAAPAFLATEEAAILIQLAERKSRDESELGEDAMLIWRALGRRKPNVLVNELVGQIRVADADPLDLLDWTGNERGMLWLVLTHTGKILEQKAVRSFFDLPKGQKVSYLRNTFGRKVGDLLDVMLPAGKHSAGAWRVADEGWMFLWVRRGSREQSQLLPPRAKV